MRYLNKVIFLNSAHIPYSEIKLDGNVHFIGTQGVGKSTLLRAILFFYNADKLKLGIPKEKRSYDEFYFHFTNSFIVYEVMRENGPYCVLTGRLFGNPSVAGYRSVVLSVLIKSFGILFLAIIVVPNSLASVNTPSWRAPIIKTSPEPFRTYS